MPPLLQMHGSALEIHLVLRTEQGEDVPVMVNGNRLQLAAGGGRFMNPAITISIGAASLNQQRQASPATL